MSFQGPVWKRHHSLSHFICSSTHFCPPWVTLKQSPDCTSLQLKIFLPLVLKDRNIFLQTLPQFHHPAHLLPGTWSVSEIYVLSEWMDDWMSEWMNEVSPALFSTASSHFTLQTLYFSQTGWLWVADDGIWLCFIEHLCTELRVWLTSCVIITTTQKGGRIPPFYRWEKRGSQSPITHPWMCSQWKSALGFKHTRPSWGSVFLPPCGWDSTRLSEDPELNSEIPYTPSLVLKSECPAHFSLDLYACYSSLLWGFHWSYHVCPMLDAPPTLATVTTWAPPIETGEQGCGGIMWQGACTASAGSSEDTAFGLLFPTATWKCFNWGPEPQTAPSLQARKQGARSSENRLPRVRFVLCWCRFQPLNPSHCNSPDNFSGRKKKKKNNLICRIVEVGEPFWLC